MKSERNRCVDEVGRVVLPKDMRCRYDIHAGDKLDLVATDEGILIKTVPSQRRGNDEREW